MLQSIRFFNFVLQHHLIDLYPILHIQRLLRQDVELEPIQHYNQRLTKRLYIFRPQRPILHSLSQRATVHYILLYRLVPVHYREVDVVVGDCYEVTLVVGVELYRFLLRA